MVFIIYLKVTTLTIEIVFNNMLITIILCYNKTINSCLFYLIVIATMLSHYKLCHLDISFKNNNN